MQPTHSLPPRRRRRLAPASKSDWHFISLLDLHASSPSSQSNLAIFATHDTDVGYTHVVCSMIRSVVSFGYSPCTENEHLPNFRALPAIIQRARLYGVYERHFSGHFARHPRPQFFTTVAASVRLRLCFAAETSRGWHGWRMAAAGERGVLRIKCSLHLTLLGSVCPPLHCCTIRSAAAPATPLPTASFVLIAPGGMTHGPYPTLEWTGCPPAPAPGKLNGALHQRRGCRSILAMRVTYD